MRSLIYKIAMKSNFLLLTIIPVLMLFIPIVYAGGARSDWSDFYDNVEGAPECWQDGYDDGLDQPFDQNRHMECQFEIEDHPDFGRPYYEAFIHGCRHAGNSQEICETFTDS
jgi:hypothetical protein